MSGKQKQKRLTAIAEDEKPPGSDVVVYFSGDAGGASSASQTRNQTNTSQHRKSRRDTVIENGVKAKILAVLDTKLEFGAHQTFTILEVSDQNFRRLNQLPQQPGRNLVKAVDDAIGRERLGLEEKRELFTLLKWEFRCLDCGENKSSERFINSSYILWSSDEPHVPQLKSGPCTECKEEARRGHRSADIIVY